MFTLLLLGDKEQERQQVHLYLENQEISLSSQCWICLLSVPISHKGLIQAFQDGMVQAGARGLRDAAAHLIHRISTKFHGTGTALIRNVVKAILTSQLTNGGTCFNLTQTHLQKVRALHLSPDFAPGFCLTATD